MCLLLIFAPQEKVKGIMSTGLVNSKLARSLNCSCFSSHNDVGFPHSTGTRGRIFTGEMAQLPGSYHHRLPMLREQTANYPSCRHLYSTGGRAEAKAQRWREFQGKSRACKGCAPPAAHEHPRTSQLPRKHLGRRKGWGGGCYAQESGSALLGSCGS